MRLYYTVVEAHSHKIIGGKNGPKWHFSRSKVDGKSVDGLNDLE